MDEPDYIPRPDNRPFEHLKKTYGVDHPKVGRLIQALPRLAQSLPYLADSITGALAKSFGLKEGEDLALLKQCAFDLLLTPLYSETHRFTGDNLVASTFVDAVQYEVAGCYADVPNEVDLLCDQTHKFRGISKYVLAGKLWKTSIPDTDAWLFGKELSAIKDGGAADVATVYAARPYSLLARIQAGWEVRYALTGIEPSESEQQALEKLLDGEKA